MASTAGPSGNWAKLQQTLPRDPESNRSKKREERKRHLSASSKSGGKQLSGIAAFARSTEASNEAGPSRTVEVPASATKEGVVFHPLPEASSLLVELREMVAGRNALNENRRQPGNYIAIDCEMVGLGQLGSESALARVSLVNYHGHILLDTFVSPRERVTDWRTWVSGIREEDLVGAPTFDEVQKKVAALAEGRILVGHAIENDLKAMLIDHPGPMVRDTQKCKMLRERAKTKRPGLRRLCELELGLGIQKGAHSSVTDARATMALYRLHKIEWEKQLRPSTEAWRQKSGKAEGKRKRDRDDDGEEAEGEEDAGGRPKKGKQAEFPGGGRKGISSGLGKIVRKNGVRVDKGGKGVHDRRQRDEEEGDGAAGNWWEEAAS